MILYIPDEVQRLEFRTRRLRVSLIVIGHVYEAGGWREEGGGKGKYGKMFPRFLFASLEKWCAPIRRYSIELASKVLFCSIL